MASIKLNMIADFKPLMSVDRFQKQNQPVLLQTAVQRYVQFLRNRYISLSAGGGEWPELADSTVASKTSRGIAENPEAILRESDTMLASLSYKKVGNQIFVGIVNDDDHPRAESVKFLAKIHTRGSPKKKLPARVVVSGPDNRTRKRMVKDIRDQYNKLIRQNRRK